MDFSKFGPLWEWLAANAVPLGVLVSLVGVIYQQGRAIEARRWEIVLHREQVRARLNDRSMELIRFMTEYSGFLSEFSGPTREAERAEPEPSKYDIAYRCYELSLNLFDEALRHRRSGLFRSEFMITWLNGCYSTHCGWGFREMWPDLRRSYSRDLREMLDQPVARFDHAIDDNARRRAFFQHCARQLHDPKVLKWADEIGPMARRAAA